MALKQNDDNKLEEFTCFSFYLLSSLMFFSVHYEMVTSPSEGMAKWQLEHFRNQSGAGQIHKSPQRPVSSHSQSSPLLCPSHNSKRDKQPSLWCWDTCSSQTHQHQLWIIEHQCTNLLQKRLVSEKFHTFQQTTPHSGSTVIRKRKVWITWGVLNVLPPKTLNCANTGGSCGHCRNKKERNPAAAHQCNDMKHICAWQSSQSVYQMKMFPRWGLSAHSSSAVRIWQHLPHFPQWKPHSHCTTHQSWGVLSSPFPLCLSSYLMNFSKRSQDILEDIVNLLYTAVQS